MINTDVSILFDMQKKSFALKNFNNEGKVHVQLHVINDPSILKVSNQVATYFRAPFSVTGPYEKITTSNIVSILNAFMNFKNAKAERDLHVEEDLDDQIILKTPLPPRKLIPPQSIYEQLTKLGLNDLEISKMSIDQMADFLFQKHKQTDRGLIVSFEKYRQENDRIQNEYQQEISALPVQEKELFEKQQHQLKAKLEQAESAYKTALQQTKLRVDLYHRINPSNSLTTVN